ncbi:hypothetical protein [Elizabethkingia anophelis]|uniref:hypothetical protein n=1 Tax=Elizabethkingia anophelis TaxID=1117645 RepID=UPI000999EAEE|nr:hypothetical protein [Elizabethkingia anophelis]OPC44640.1 hypothetical protein BAY05_14100 [Elizabethkingia anophelis]
MSEFKGTGGTWSVSGEKYFTIESKVQHERYVVPIVTIATVNSSFRPTEEAKANAKLISKAPEMLEMLKRCEVRIEPKDIHISLLNDLRQLIKEATE